MTNQQTKKVLLWVAVAIIVVAFAAAISRAGTLGVECNYDPGNGLAVTHMRFYADGQPLGDPVPAQTRVVDGVSQRFAETLLTDVPDGCTERVYSCTGKINNSPESDHSPSSVSIARPEVTGVLMNVDGLRQVTGHNFTEGTTVTDENGTARDTNFLACELLEVAEDPAQPFWQITVTVPSGLTPAVYALPIPVPNAPVTE